MERERENMDPFDRFRDWYEEAAHSSLGIPNAMCLSTVRAGGTPASRMVLLSSFDRRGFVFHTNCESAKGGEIAACPRVALLFWWEPLNRQVRIEGVAEKTSPEESDAYFAKRPRGAQLGAWASEQSRPIRSTDTLAARVRDIEKRHEGGPVPRPPHWGGYRVVPCVFEFWTGRENRLHDRFRYGRTPDGWAATQLYP
jgi:pyridoxamine 5'-phosphate oxidase